MSDILSTAVNEPLRVLVIEDEALVSLILEDMLTDLGHQTVGPFASVSAGLESAKRDRIDVAIVDLNLGGANSLPIVDALQLRNVPVIFSTGYGRGSLPERYGDAPLLQKPFQQHDIQSAIAQALA